ncbi:hypothetical protein POUND7_007098 [Theobroma cacao]
MGSNLNVEVGDGCREGRTKGRWWKRVLDFGEAKKQVFFAVPMVLSNLFYFSITMVSVMFAGHLGELELAGSTLANSWATVTGFAFMTGLSGALETLCGQGFGAKMYRMLGIYLQASCIISFLFSVIISILWFYTEPILVLLHQDPEISRTAALYMKYLIPGVQYLQISEFDVAGVARGCGWQHLAVWANLGTFYLIGMPIAGVLGFKFKLYVKSLLIFITQPATQRKEACQPVPKTYKRLEGQCPRVQHNYPGLKEEEKQTTVPQEEGGRVNMASSSSLDTALLPEASHRQEESKEKSFWGKVLDVEELKKQVLFSLPMVLTNAFYYAITLVSVMFAGHLGELELAGATLANSWATVSGFAFMIGLSGALETLCGQGFGAKTYRVLGIYLQASCIISCLFSIIISIIWFYTEPILILLHQEPQIAKKADLYIKYLIPAVFAFGFIQNVLRFLQTQSILMPLVLFSGLPLALHFGIVYTLVHWTSLGFKGASLASSISLWISFIFLATYVVCSKKFEHTWGGFSSESFRHIVTNLRLSLPSAAMVCGFDVAGVARGCGWQHLVVVANLVTFYGIGMPIAVLLGFKFKLYAKVKQEQEVTWIGNKASGDRKFFAEAIFESEKL